DSYFVLGDNRSISLDSRMGWFVRADELIGRAWLAYWPPTVWGVVSQPLVAEVAPPAPQPATLIETANNTEKATAVATTPPVEPTPTPAPTAIPVRPILSGTLREQVGWLNDPSGTAWLDG